MIPYDIPEEPPMPERSTEDMLRELCEQQRVQMLRMQLEIDTATRANRKLAGELLQASEQRADKLVELQDKVHVLKTQTQTVCAQRDAVEQALRALWTYVNAMMHNPLSRSANDKLTKALVETGELLHLIDQAKARAANGPRV